MNRFANFWWALIKTGVASVILVCATVFLFYEVTRDWQHTRYAVGLALMGSLGFWLHYTSLEYNAAVGALRGWQTAPINHYNVELFVPTDNPRQLRRDKIELTDAEWRELWKIARDLDAGEKFTARSTADYSFWRKRFFRWGWLEWTNPSNHLAGVTFTERGEDWLSHFANSPSPKELVSISTPKHGTHTG